MELRKEGLEMRQLRIRQPKQIRHVQRSLSNRETHRWMEINGSYFSNSDQSKPYNG